MVIGVPEKWREGMRQEKKFEEIMAANFPNWVKDIKLQIKEAQWTQTRNLCLVTAL